MALRVTTVEKASANVIPVNPQLVRVAHSIGIIARIPPGQEERATSRGIMHGGVDGGLSFPTFPAERVLRSPPVPDRIENSAKLTLHTSDELVGRLARLQVQVDLG